VDLTPKHTSIHIINFYRASAYYACRARYCVSKSVRLSVCPSHFQSINQSIKSLYFRHLAHRT